MDRAGLTDLRAADHDEFGWSKFMYHYPPDDDGWDGFSVEMAPDGTVSRKLAAIPLVTLNATMALVRQVQNQGGVLTANAAPLTRTYAVLPTDP